MPYSSTSALKKIMALKKRLHVIQGGSSAGKTIAILLVLINKAQSEKGKLISVVSETFPHLRRGAIKDFLSIMEEHKYFKEDNWSKTDFTYTFETGSRIEFFSADSSDKVRGPRREILFINECNNVSYETYTQLSIRTSEEIYLDYNPVSEFWVHTEILNKVDNDFLIITYLDNEALPATVVKEIESRKENKHFWTVYGLGQIGQVEENIFSNWQILDEVPHEAKLVRRGLDFGYTNDPTAQIAIYRFNGAYIIDEEIYLKGLSNKQIADINANLEERNTLVKADCAEPKSIDELRSYGMNILPAKKGKDSVNAGIQLIQSQKISVTKRSTNLIKEYRNYRWMVDKNAKVMNVPIDIWNHCMDALRYGFEEIDGNEDVREKQLERFTHNKFNIMSNNSR